MAQSSLANRIFSDPQIAARIKVVLRRVKRRTWVGRINAGGIQATRRLRPCGKRLTNYTPDDVRGVVNPVCLAQAAGVSSAVWLIGRSASPIRARNRITDVVHIGLPVAAQ
jgi:hypothetical protein